MAPVVGTHGARDRDRLAGRHRHRRGARARGRPRPARTARLTKRATPGDRGGVFPRSRYHSLMRSIAKFLLVLVVLGAVGGAGAWFWAGTLPGPAVTIRQPGALVGQAGMLDMMVETPGGKLSRLEATLEQGDRRMSVYSQQDGLPAPGSGEAADRLYVMRPIGRRAFPELQSGKARIVVTAARPVLFGIREASTTVTRDVEVRLEPPRVEVLSTFHYINHGGSEFVVYRATPADVESGVRVGDKEYRGFPAKGVGIPDPAARVAFFALLFDQPLDARIAVFARDAAGNEAMAPLDSRVFPKPYRTSRIEVDDKFLNQVVPAIAAATPDEKIPTDDLVKGFLQINGDLRRKNNQYLASLASKTDPEATFRDAFQQLGNSQVEARFADTRTYLYQGKEIDMQVHLGFDLAVTANVAVVASQRGTVVHAAYLGIYGNCVVLDHGLGVQSLYAHLSSIGVKVGDKVEKGQEIGRSGMTGLAGGDHLHFTMLVGGQQVTPVDWWSVQWMQDRVLRKIAAAGGV
jgi:murein DD-endopeptidase MepM/ murein hydrolase activator NlpD